MEEPIRLPTGKGCSLHSSLFSPKPQHHKKYQHVHQKTFTCSEPSCGKSFNFKKHLKEHEKLHSGEPAARAPWELRSSHLSCLPLFPDLVTMQTWPCQFLSNLEVCLPHIHLFLCSLDLKICPESILAPKIKDPGP